MAILLNKELSLRELLETSRLNSTLRVRVSGRIFTLSSLGKVMLPGGKNFEPITKLDLLRYYNDVQRALLPHVKDRPLTLKRFPTGLAGPHFYQHDLPDAPDELTTHLIASKTEGEKRYAFANDLGDLLYLVNIGAIAQNPYLVRWPKLDRPDWVVFDLDPQKKASFDDVLEVALEVRRALTAHKLNAWAKTSGSRGIHVVVPIRRSYSFAETSAFAKTIAAEVAAALPRIATTVRMVAKRDPKHVYVDYLQNLYGKSIVAPYSVREKPGGPVSMPVTWREIERGLEIYDFTIANARERLKKRGEIFRPVLTTKQSLTRV